MNTELFFRKKTILKPLYTLIYILIHTITLIYLTSCDNTPESPKGFSLPKGNIEKGKTVFLKYTCLSCHSIDSQLIKETDQSSIETELENRVHLGGEVTQVKTYADLVTSVINPSHRIAKKHRRDEYHTEGISKMKNYNDIMTVNELIDLVTFLQPHYNLVQYRETHYGVYP